MGSVPIPVCAAPGGRKAGVLGDVVSDYGGSDFVHLQPAVGFRNLHRTEPQFARLLQQVAGDGEILVLDLLDVGDDLVEGELFRRLPDKPVLLGEILRGEDFVGAAIFEQKTAAGDRCFRNCCYARHGTALCNHEGGGVHQGKMRVRNFHVLFIVLYGLLLSLPPCTVHEALDAILQVHYIEV